MDRVLNFRDLGDRDFGARVRRVRPNTDIGIVNINPEDEDFLFRRSPKRVQEMARRARSQRRVEARAEFMAQNVPAKQKGRGW